LAPGIAREKNVGPFKVILLKENKEIGSRKCKTRTEAVAYVKTWQSLQSGTVSATIVDDNGKEIVFEEKAKESKASRPREHRSASPKC
jgi:hypothetical protein